MSNPFEAVWKTLKSMVDIEPKSPLHVGEVMSFWTYLTVLDEAIRYEEVGLNTTTDDEVKELLVDAKKLCESQSQRLSNFMQKEGIPLPPGPKKKPKSEPQEVPLGVKFTDDEIANGVSLKIATAGIECALGNSQSIRTDVGLIWIELYTEMLTFGATTKSLLRKRGWIKVPPYYTPTGLTKS
ncbi:hypothetical protein JOC85_001030 [Bacillus mesophilus]|uniref:DUF3231 family protein n=1 Tax=Bacillus mesophilus TaxID=1808955 RepID=A0A6M0Q794_9BACI|nr:DUF3231 family protein [Bacillus mesophilus]MBM7660263.1 hypothetical protein [Bacillus mesophilus]NEY70978.1 DUF3231 family protein [Bacillus mesophilus]